jgi:hypothetical protein
LPCLGLAIALTEYLDLAIAFIQFASEIIID